MSPMIPANSLFKYFLLPAYITFETTRAILSFAAVHSQVRISSTFIAFSSELLKLVFALIFLCRFLGKTGNGVNARSLKSAILFASSDQAGWRAYGPYAVPAALYLINNLLYLLGLQLTTPSLLHVAVLAKLPFTGILHHLLVKRQRNLYAWLSLALICTGLLIFNAPIEFLDWIRGVEDPLTATSTSNTNTTTPAFQIGVFIGPIVGLVIATLSGFASIFTEVIMKQKVAFWVAQVWLYFYGTLFAGTILLFWDGRLHSFSSTSTPSSDSDPSTSWAIFVNAAVILATTATGLVVANILRKADNLVKLVGSSASIVTIIAAQVALFPDLREKTIQVPTTLGAGIIAISTWTYNHHKTVQPSRVSAKDVEQFDLGVDSEDEGEHRDSGDRTSRCPRSQASSSTTTLVGAGDMNGKDCGATTPNWRKVTVASFIVAILTYVTSFYAYPTSSAPSGVIYGRTDVERFFKPHNVQPAVWGRTENPVDCVREFVQREEIWPRSHKLVDWELAFLDSGCPVYPVPEGGMIFHQYWSGNWRSFNEVAIEAWLATQRLGDGHKLIYWYENGEPSAETRERFATGEYGKYVEFRKFDRLEEGKGFCVETMPEYYDEEYQRSLKMKQSTLSDIVRNLLLAKYGGIWLDADTIPLRDLTPLIRSGPSAPYIGNSESNNNILIFGPTEAGIGSKILETTCTMSFNETLFHERYPTINPNMWYWLYNDGLFKICQKLENCGVNRHPIMFTDGRYFTGPNQEATEACPSFESGQEVEQGKPLPASLHGLWTWHNRLGARKDDCLNEDADTLAMAMRRRVREMLSYGLDMNGRDIFPGPGYA
ncbi:hypothetical protein G7K_5695-t1 [Saitoella complicata NRRL Y-17804]|uniref:Uncharacterized protein n=1 Tax=Saitoella complicata (strain BCRC 22490 / CBS 7301 / JCM 7358 / NBRC 10748 / NRRL Y-17804) TaxID=698492 RepID=A0A0E9NPJ7_SAICN|nr:hypothetical protein G7K_5695-t1 [Saitoella complicata NRRL Y-17804]